MDKLEKALEKARLERRDALERDAAPDVVAPAGNGQAPAANGHGGPIQAEAAPSRTRLVEISDRVLEENRIVARNHDNNSDVFRILRTKVHQALGRSNLKSVGVTSPNYGEGKTTIAVNLALSLALDVKQTVCLVDLNLRSPRVHSCLGIGTEVGLGDYLLYDAPLSDCLVRPNYERLVVLPTSQALSNSSETLATPKMAALANELQSRYSDRIVIYDLPPVLPQDDVLGFLPHLDSVLVVIKEGITPANDLRRCLHALGDTRLLGTVLNKSFARGDGAAGLLSH